MYHQDSPAPARAVDLPAGIALGAAIGRIARHCLAQVRAHSEGVARGDDPESVHQMRVGLRRLRSALRLFRPWLRLPRELRRELDWLGRALGAARDADVLAISTLPALGRKAAGLAPLAAGAAGIRRRRAAAAVASARYARLVLRLGDWFHDQEGHSAAALAEPVEQHAARLIAGLRRKLDKAGRKLARGSTEDRHRLRIAAKRLRYAMEFFQAVLPAEPTRRRIQALARLQDTLGRLNDAVVADSLLHRLTRPGQKRDRLGNASRAARKAIRRRAAGRDLREAQESWRRLRGLGLPA